ncbi:MAG: TSUP family transporter [Anaerolineae bacterium]|nr:TSUP family transporter [Anaerolineae bacterium]
MDPSLIILFVIAFMAGFVDSIVGGGGLIQLPALLIFLPHYPVATVFGTNKLVSITGTGTATLQYSRHVKIPWKSALITAASAFIFSMLGARTVSLINPQILRPLIIILLVVMAAYIFFQKDLGSINSISLNPHQQIIFSLLAGALIGFYDGFFGPGTGSFLIFAFIAFLGYNFIVASASAKIVNFATNLAALIFFAFNGNILFHIALPMAVFNILGALAGTRMAILKGNRFVRILFLIVVAGVIIKLILDTVGFSL